MPLFYFFNNFFSRLLSFVYINQISWKYLFHLIILYKVFILYLSLFKKSHWKTPFLFHPFLILIILFIFLLLRFYKLLNILFKKNSFEIVLLILIILFSPWRPRLRAENLLPTKCQYFTNICYPFKLKFNISCGLKKYSTRHANQRLIILSHTRMYHILLYYLYLIILFIITILDLSLDFLILIIYVNIIQVFYYPFFNFYPLQSPSVSINYYFELFFTLTLL